MELPGERERALWFVHGEGDDTDAKRCQLGEPVAVLRQLAETEWSPVAAVEHQQERLLGAQIGEPAGHAGSIGNAEVRRDIRDIGRREMGHCASSTRLAWMPRTGDWLAHEARAESLSSPRSEPPSSYAFDSTCTSFTLTVQVARSGLPSGANIDTLVDSDSITQRNGSNPSLPQVMIQ
jgi:hypothetical protein